MTDRQRILDRIRKLKALAGDRGATPEEAIAAADPIRRMIHEYGLDDVDMTAADIATDEVDLGRSKRQAIDLLVGFVAYATGCVAVTDRRPGGLVVVYVGADPAPVIAAYLHEVCYRAVECAAAEFRRSAEYLRRRKASTRSAALKSFKAGMIDRLGRKLAALGWLTKDQRDRLFLAYERRCGIALGSAEPLKAPSHTARYAGARYAGDQAGRDVDLHRPIAGAGDVGLIGSR